MTSLWWKLSTIISCGTLAGAIIPEVVKIFTSTESGHVREVVTSSEQGGASLNILSGLVAGNFSAYWMGMIICRLMGIAYQISIGSIRQVMCWPRRVCLRSGRLRFSRHGAGDHRGRQLRTGDGQRAIGV